MKSRRHFPLYLLAGAGLGVLLFNLEYSLEAAFAPDLNTLELKYRQQTSHSLWEIQHCVSRTRISGLGMQRRGPYRTFTFRDTEGTEYQASSRHNNVRGTRLDLIEKPSGVEVRFYGEQERKIRADELEHLRECVARP